MNCKYLGLKSPKLKILIFYTSSPLEAANLGIHFSTYASFVEMHLLEGPNEGHAGM